jgi:hypothetical protein
MIFGLTNNGPCTIIHVPTKVISLFATTYRPKSPLYEGCGFDPQDLQNIRACEFRLEFLSYLKKIDQKSKKNKIKLFGMFGYFFLNSFLISKKQNCQIIYDIMIIFL